MPAVAEQIVFDSWQERPVAALVMLCGCVAGALCGCVRLQERSMAALVTKIRLIWCGCAGLDGLIAQHLFEGHALVLYICI